MAVEITITPGQPNQVDIGQPANPVTLVGSPSVPGILPVSLFALGNIPIGRLVANVGGRAVLYDVRNAAHAYALVGVAITSALDATRVLVLPSGRVNIPGWGLQPGQQYRAGQAGQLITGPEASGALFSQVIGRAISADAFQLNFQSILIH